MTRSRTAVNVATLFAVLALTGASAMAGMTPQQCYARDSSCTQMCGQVTDSGWRHECFNRCDIYLDNCLGRGVWTDQAAVLSPDGGGATPTKGPFTPIGVLDKRFAK